MQPNSSAVQPRAWYNALPRAQYASLQRVPVGQAWFEVYRLPGDVYALYESAHFQEVISFLILGRDAALLWDTGMGVGDMRALVRQLTDLPLVVLNSHCHFDHVGGNWQFDTVYACDCAASLAVLRAGQPNAEVGVHMIGEAACRPYPAGFDAQGYAIQPCNPRPVADGHVFDLGGRRMRVLYTPGHSPDSIMLLDEEQGCLYTGDTLYPATLYAHLHMPGGIRSDIRQYARTLRILAGRADIRRLHCSHNEPVAQPGLIAAAADAFDALLRGEAPFEVDEAGLRKYAFDGFAVVTSNPL